MGQSCAQIWKKAPPTSQDPEDCLNMNIFTTSLRTDVQRPVIVYVHGGSFSSGSNADYPPKYVLERDVVLAVPNYRVDALGKFWKMKILTQSARTLTSTFHIINTKQTSVSQIQMIHHFCVGFLSTKTAEIPGNAGVLDVVLALKWVKRNIKYFGGNPNKITVMGQSSGGAMVSSLLLSPLVPDNLFQQMIIHSGTIFAPWAYALDPVSYAKDIAFRAHVPKNSSLREINDALMRMDVYELLNATNEHYVIGFGFIYFAQRGVYSNSFMTSRFHWYFRMPDALKAQTKLAVDRSRLVDPQTICHSHQENFIERVSLKRMSSCLWALWKMKDHFCQRVSLNSFWGHELTENVL